MRKRKLILKRRPFTLSKTSEALLRLGLSVILMPLLRLIYDIRLAAPFSPATAADFGAYLEHILAALMLLTVAVYLTERVVEAEDKEK